MCETELKLIFYVWHQEKLWFSIKNIFDFFSGEKNLYVKPSWKLFLKLVFFVMCEIELKPSEGKFFHVWKQKKLFFGRKTFFFFFMSENLFSMNKTDRTFVFPHVKPPTRKKLYFKENIFFFSAKKIFVQQKKLFTLLCVKPR